MSQGIITARASRWLALGLVTLLSACLGRSPDPRYFVLGESGPVVEGEGERTISIQLASATLPDYLVRPEMVWREGGAEISIHAQQRWAGGLEANVLRALGSRLAGQPGMSWVVVHPQQPRAPVDFRVDVVFDELLAEKGGSLRLRARWVIQVNGKGLVSTGSVALEESLESDSARALVEAHEAALEALANAIVTQLSQPGQNPGAE